MRSLTAQDIAALRVAKLLSSGQFPVDTTVSDDLSNAIVRNLSQISKLNADTMKKLTPDHFKISEVAISDCTFDEDSLSIILSHPLQKLSTTNKFRKEMGGSDISFPISVPSLTHWDLTGSCIKNEDLLQSIGLMPNLRTLILSHTGVDNAVLDKITNLNNKLVSIDLSYTSVFNIAPIGRLTSIKVLSLRSLNLKLKDNEDILSGLTSLEVLDLSTDIDDRYYIPEIPQFLFKVIANEAGCLWPNLRSLDLSYNNMEELDNEDQEMLFRAIVAKHPKLTRFYICGTDFEGQEYTEATPSTLTLVDTAKLISASIDQLAQCSEISGTIEALEKMRSILANFDNFRRFDKDQIIEAMRYFVQAMVDYPESYEVQLLATACCFSRLIGMATRGYLNLADVHLFIDKCITAVEHNHNLCSILLNLSKLFGIIEPRAIVKHRVINLSIDILETTSDVRQMRSFSECLYRILDRMTGSGVDSIDSIVTESKLIPVLFDRMRQLTKDPDTADFLGSTFSFITYTFIALFKKSFLARSTLVQKGIIPVLFEIVMNEEDRMAMRAIELLIYILVHDEFQDIDIDSQYIKIFMPNPPCKMDTEDIFCGELLMELLAYLLTSRYPCENIVRSKEQLNQIMVNAVKLRYVPRTDVFSDIRELRFRAMLRLISRNDATGPQLYAIWRISFACEQYGDEEMYRQIIRDEGGVETLLDLVSSSTAFHDLRTIAQSLLYFVE